jgi:anti-anti-sigma regulatory factor
MRTKGDMKVIGVNEVINEIFEVTGFNDILDVELAGDAEE